MGLKAMSAGRQGGYPRNFHYRNGISAMEIAAVRCRSRPHGQRGVGRAWSFWRPWTAPVIIRIFMEAIFWLLSLTPNGFLMPHARYLEIRT